MAGAMWLLLFGALSSRRRGSPTWRSSTRSKRQAPAAEPYLCCIAQCPVNLAGRRSMKERMPSAPSALLNSGIASSRRLATAASWPS